MDDQNDDLSTISKLTRIVRAQRLASSVLLRSVSELDLFNDICRLIVEVGGYRMACVGLAQNDARRSINFVAVHGIEVGYLEKANITWADDTHGQGPTGMAIKTGKVQINQDFATNRSVELWKDIAASHGFVGSIALPLKDDQTVFGALTIYSSETDTFDFTEVDMLTVLVDDIAFGVSAMRNRVLAGALSEKLQKNLQLTIEILAETMEVRDPYTAGHQRRVADLGRAIAGELSLTRDRSQGIYLAGLVHDIGKFSVPSEILAKPSRLKPEEMALVKMHSKVGHDILVRIEFPWPISEFILQHHERLDGSGYPNGLKGDQICLEARILAVADVVEAITAHRPYRPALGLDKALEDITDHRGVLYDGSAVDACVALFKSGRFQFA